MRELEGRAGTFNAQDVANTLWAYATMGRKPGAGVMRGWSGGRRRWRARSTLREWGAGLMRGLDQAARDRT